MKQIGASKSSVIENHPPDAMKSNLWSTNTNYATSAIDAPTGNQALWSDRSPPNLRESVEGVRMESNARQAEPVLSDRQFVTLAGFTLVTGLFGLAVVFFGLVGFWLTATNRWAADSIFLFTAFLVVLVCVGVGLFTLIRSALRTADGRMVPYEDY